MLMPIWEKYDRFWVTFKKQDALSLLKDEKIYGCYYPTNRSALNLVRNTCVALRILFKEKPDIIISSGAAVAVPFFYIGKLLGSKLIYIEVFDRINSPTLSGKIIYPVTDIFVVQWVEQLIFYPKGIYLGELL
jgi:UDP-N-acetylglucosamine:LPS N-acetylglucosamine transferase